MGEKCWGKKFGEKVGGQIWIWREHCKGSKVGSYVFRTGSEGFGFWISSFREVTKKVILMVKV